MRYSRKFLSVMVISVMLVCFMAGCGKTDPLVGTWNAVGVKSAGEEMSLAELHASIGLELTAEIEFRSNGKAVGKIMNEELNGQWSGENGSYVLSDSGDEELEFTVSGNTFELSSSDYSIIFERATE